MTAAVRVINGPKIGKSNKVNEKAKDGETGNIFVEIAKNPEKATVYGFKMVSKTGTSVALLNRATYSAADIHLLVIPLDCQGLTDIRKVQSKHRSMLESLHKDGLVALRQLKPDQKSEEIFAGYNLQPSVPYLHMHMIAGPLKPKQKLVNSHRWASHQKILQSLG
jgi:diadenosine tetraphosphate (Ap4A) HIT family hydrolase